MNYESLETVNCANSLIDYDAILENIRSAQTVGDAIEALRKLGVVEEALRCVHRFEEESVRYAILQAEAIIRVCELGGISRFGPVTSTKFKTASWLFNMNGEERNKFIGMCKDGLVIEQIYKREVADVERKDGRVLQVKDELKALVQTFESNGFVDMADTNRYVQRSIGCYGDGLVQDLIDGARNDLLKAGAVGTGCSVYVKPGVGDKAFVTLALLIRYESILNDINRLVEISKTAKSRLNLSDLLDLNGSIMKYEKVALSGGNRDNRHYIRWNKFYGSRKENDTPNNESKYAPQTLYLILALMVSGCVERDQKIYELIQSEKDMEAGGWQ